MVYKNKKLVNFIFSGIIGLLLVTSPSFAIENKLTKPVLIEKVQQSERDKRQYEVVELANKMRVLLVSDPKAVKSLASLALPVGSLQDPKDQQGLAHYAEHMVLMGSKKYPEPASFSQFLSRHAGSYNASTAAHRTAFYFEVENSAFDKALDYLADAISEPNLDPKFADKERNAVNAELTMARSNDGFRIGQVDSETINQNHPSSQFSGGNLETLSDKENSKLQDALVNFHKNYYSANIMVGVMYSNQSINKLAKLAENSFGKIPNKNINAPIVDKPAITPNVLNKQISMVPAQPKKLLFLQFPIENNLAKFADKTDEYITYLISNSSHNTLSDQLQKQGLIEGISSSINPIRYGNSGIFSINVSLTDDGLAQKDKVIGAIFNYLQLIQKQGISDAYYEELKKVLALEFKYQDVERDMSYVEWLSDQMLLYPVKNILNSDFIANNFDKTAITARLKSLTPDNVRVWIISPNQTTNKTAYFVDAPYKIDNITSEQKANWLALGKNFTFSLPELNPYIPDDFSIVKQNRAQAQPAGFSKRGNHLHFVSQYFKTEPKAAIVVSLRNNEAFSDAKAKVAFNLLDYIASRNLEQLRFQAGVAGISLSTNNDNGLMISASGFSQHLPKMVTAILESYRNVTIDEQSLALAKSWYLQELDKSEHAKSYWLAVNPVNELSDLPYFERDERRQITATMTINDVLTYRDNLLTHSVPYMLSLGNLSNEDSLDLYHSIQKTLVRDVEFTPVDNIQIKKSLEAKMTQHAKSTDSALMMSYIPTGYDRIASSMLSYTLSKIISPWFYDQLRTNEQLGYAVFASPVTVGDSVGMSFIIQSNQYDPAYLLKRYQEFYPVILNKLKALSKEDIEQYKKAALNELKMPPQTLDEEFSRYMADYRNSRFAFDSRHKKIEQLKKISQQDLVDFYNRSVMDKKGFVFASQVLGKSEDSAKQSEAISEFTEFENVSALQNELLK
ncbi:MULTISPECIES: pitrilysin [unclassified Gilliamella]|uniref:pitrilysin n=1 Tax=unclassified Gilliamella TaxID=2685620 RepID=UPI001309679E|nr:MULTISPECIES: pitrilysin [unclassified Gilliamella]MWP48859.1 pitrilysin [Gilliamella sp. Lep-s35]MWP68797.1 pitrilysin [Gilliamella sp. Lep-s5]MWP77130.1 pitrilysin [Gilliamella sp. Lep-s21]